ncbi:GNAT family N-acetyltransferase [Thermovibrio sp.]
MENFSSFFPLLKEFLGEVYGSPERGLRVYQSKYRALDYYKNYRAKPNSFLLVLKREKEPVGFFYGRHLKNYSYIYDIFVKKEYRGLGLGKELLSTFSRLAPAPYRADVCSKALSAFKKWGFKELKSYEEDGVLWHLVEAPTL